MLRLISAISALVAAGVVYFLLLLRRKRKELDGLPQPPMTNWLLGHLPLAGDCTAHFPDGVHTHNWARYMQKKHGLGEVFYVDWWPLGPRWLFMSNPELISQHVTANLPKSPLETDYLDDFLGPHNMVSVDGPHWKNLRTMFNPGFASSHLMTLVPYIVDASLVFRDVIHKKAENNELFEMEEAGTRLTIDIIGKVVLDSDFDSQKQMHPIVHTFRDRVNYMPPNQGIAAMFDHLHFIRRFKLWRNKVKLDRLIGEELDRKIAARNAAASANGSAKIPTSFKDRKRSVIDLALDAYQKEFATSTKPGAPMDKAFRDAAIDSMKTFIFAGHDTTSSTIAYIFYLLHFHPKEYSKLVAELDSVFGKGASAAEIAEQIKADPYSVNQLDYCTAIIKETLRLFPPASTLRYTRDKHNLTFPDPKDPSKQLPLSGFVIWPVVHLVSRNEKFFPQPTRFIPERFIPSETPFPYPQSHLMTPAGKDAFRAFEKGPRACIGEQLAMLETKIILALTVKEFDFVCEFDGKAVENPWRSGEQETCVELPAQKDEWENEKGRWKAGRERGADGHWKGRTVEGHECWQILRGAAKPRGGMPGRMRLRG